jgi:ADP-dependent NAD(P)H-hydrate dehydratase / NAD(P)H-hydrate epimerase
MNKNTPIYLTAEIRKIEQLAADMSTPTGLMEKAGLAAAEVVRDKLLTSEKNKVLVLAGPGNNGGDAFVVARHLQEWWFKVTLVFTGVPAKLSDDAKNSMDAWIAAGGEILSEIPTKNDWNAIVDGLFGIGLSRDLEGLYRELVNVINHMNLPVLALDIPSGLNSDNGRVCGSAIYANITVTFISLKPGLLTHHGAEYCGEIILRNFDIDTSALIKPQSWILDLNCAQNLLPPPRPANSHKGMFGSVGVIGGSDGMTGAALLAGTAALKLGSGRVYLGLITDNAPGVDPMHPELMFRSPHELFKIDHLNCLVIGPGLGMSTNAYFWLDCALKSTKLLVLDADALNLISAYPKLANKLISRKAHAVLTPHAAEAARILGISSTEVQNNRVETIKNLVDRFNCYAVLKGAGSICMLPDGRYYINTSGNPGLSTAGTGDVLTGIIGALLTQGIIVENALLLAVFLHGAAADELLEQIGGPVGITASEITDAARVLLNQWVYNS